MPHESYSSTSGQIYYVPNYTRVTYLRLIFGQSWGSSGTDQAFHYATVYAQCLFVVFALLLTEGELFLPIAVDKLFVFFFIGLTLFSCLLIGLDLLFQFSRSQKSAMRLAVVLPSFLEFFITTVAVSYLIQAKWLQVNSK